MSKLGELELGGILILIAFLLYEIFGKDTALQNAFSSAETVGSNALTGQLTDQQKQELVDQESTQLQANGMSKAAADAQATKDVNAASSQTPSYWQALWTSITSPSQTVQSITQ